MIKPARELINRLLDGDLKPSAVDMIGGVKFMKYDRIVVTDRHVKFSFQGMPVFYVDHNADFSRGDTLTIDQLEGRTLLDIV
jgi:hypothetical protein